MKRQALFTGKKTEKSPAGKAFYSLVIVLIFWLIAATLYAQSSSVHILADKGSAYYKIIIPAHACDAEKRAADLLQTYLQKMSGISFPVKNDQGSKQKKKL